MKLIQNEKFNDYIDSYKKLPLSEKQQLIISELQRVISCVCELNGEETMLYNREILDLKKDYTQDDFSESVFVYLHSLEECLGTYIEKVKES